MKIANNQMTMNSMGMSTSLSATRASLGKKSVSGAQGGQISGKGKGLSSQNMIKNGLSFQHMIKANKEEMVQEEEQNSTQIRQLSLLYLLDMLFGEKSRRSLWRDAMGNGMDGYNLSMESTYFTQESYVFEQQEAAFQTAGRVMTEDGRCIDFNMNVYMSSSFEAYYKEQYEMIQPTVELCDPLVINLQGNIAEVKDQTFYFDLDGDGTKENIHSLNSYSGFLALDKNGNGTIDDGSELFGTTSGDGFKDLARYDEDHNGWIDENDSIFDKLKIWVQDDNGKSTLYTLKEQNVGAICLNHVPTYINQYDQNGNTSAVIRSTGMFLFEDGKTGTMQHLDMAT